MYELEKEMLGLYDAMASADADKIDEMMEEAGEIQQILEAEDFISLTPNRRSGRRPRAVYPVGLDRDVAELSGGQRTKVLLVKLLLENPSILILDERPTIWITRT